MNYKKILINALKTGVIKGHESEIAKALLLCDKDEIVLYKIYIYFPDVIASVWRNREVINHLDKMNSLSFDLALEIFKRVEWTPEEIHRIHEFLFKRRDISVNFSNLMLAELTPVEKIKVIENAFENEDIRKAASNLLSVESDSLSKISEEVWKVVLSRE